MTAGAAAAVVGVPVVAAMERIVATAAGGLSVPIAALPVCRHQDHHQHHRRHDHRHHRRAQSATSEWRMNHMT
jgi:hypothetical protein